MKRRIKQWLETVFRMDVVLTDGKAICRNKQVGFVKNGAVTFYKAPSKNWIMKLFNARRIVCITYYKYESASF